MSFPDFQTFFKALWPDREPFPWQTILAEQVCNGTWPDGFPDAVDLPTASGKTACLDIAVYALAAQAVKPLGERNAARRVWFVVDRRIVVDEAYDRACKLAKALENPRHPVLVAVAERLLALRGLPGTLRPLAVGRLRGGVLLDDGWARIPSQAAIITSTVDQLGSRILFRGYGHSALTAPIFAGLAGNDSLILLDEAHCAVPFLQTLRAVKMYRSAKWSEEPNTTPFHVAVLSATPPEDDHNEEKPTIFPADEDERETSLDHPVLRTRLNAAKLAELKTVKKAEQLAANIADAAGRFARRGTMRVGVIVNRVARAAEIAARLLTQSREEIFDHESPAFDVHLLTGRLRPFERDEMVGVLHPLLHSASTVALERPLILVSTQCLEVGADFSFDALVTECASLDALRQRFGRLARLGAPASSEAVIFAAEDSLTESDPVYGDATKATWEFLVSKAGVGSRTEGVKAVETRTIDFGFESLRNLLPTLDEMKPLLAPVFDAPVLLPAHLDLLCQTAPMPHPNPDIAVFLHGKGRQSAEVRVGFRCDLDPRHPEHWPEIASVCRPVSSELFSIPLRQLRSWLTGKDDSSGDVEGEHAIGEEQSVSRSNSAFLIVRGRDDSIVSDDVFAINPDATVLLPAPREEAGLARIRQLAQVHGKAGFGSQQVDIWELAVERTGKAAPLRLHRECLAPWLDKGICPPLRVLMTLVDDGEPSRAELLEGLAAVRAWQPGEGEQALPDWLGALFQKTQDFRFNDIARYPAGGMIIFSRKTSRPREAVNYSAEDKLDNDTDEASEAPEVVSLATHSSQVAREAAAFARACLRETASTIFSTAGTWHDMGKLDERFQEILRGGALDDGSPPLAKSPNKPRSSEQAEAIRTAARLPSGFRHEMLSMLLAKRFATSSLPEGDSVLLLHLIASHHGHARPFAPVCDDPAPSAISFTHAGTVLALSTAERIANPAHRLDSAIADRFWQTNRRFGWWGLAYREAILRLADWHASEQSGLGNLMPVHE